MAIFRAETKHISRSKKHNVVAAAAYRAAEKLTDTNEFNPDAITHDYSKKHGVVASDIILPKSLVDQDFTIDRQTLWSSVEQSETTTRSVKGSRLKQSARLAREWLLSLPDELSDNENEQLTREFTTKLANDLGVIADYSIHRPTPFDIKPKKLVGDTELRTPVAPDSRNIHAHIMFTTRKAELNAKNELIFTEKADSERSEKWRQEQKLGNGGDYIKEIREMWSDMLNKRLEQKNILPVSAKSYKDLGLDIVPQVKQGKDATVMSRYHFKPQTIGFNHDIKQLNRITIKSAADSIIAASSERSREPVIEFKTSSDRIREQIANSAADDRHRENEQRVRERKQGIAYTEGVYDRVAEFNTRQARKRDAESAGAGEQLGNSAAYERISESERRIDEQSRRIKYSNVVYNRAAEFDTTPVRAVSATSERTRERERLIAESTSEEHFYRDTTAKAIASHERNLRIISNRLIFRNRDSAKYDDRQMKTLDAFYKTLDIRDFAVTTGLSREEYIQPNEWVGLVRERLTDDKIINNTQVIAIVRDPVAEQSSYLAKTSQNASDSVEIRKTQNSSLESSKALESAIETYQRPKNTFRL